MEVVRIENDTYSVRALYQWDLNQVLHISGLNLTSAPEIHFTNKTMREALVIQASQAGPSVFSVDIPNILLQQPHDITVYICTREGDVYQCLYKMVIPVKARQKPSDYVYTETEVLTYRTIEKRLSNLEQFGGTTDEQIAAAVAAYLAENPAGGSSVAIGTVDLPAANWTGSGNLYSQVVTIAGVTENSQVDLTPSVEQLAIFYDKSLALVAENDGGVVTVYAIGQRPENDYTIQVTITEVSA